MRSGPIEETERGVGTRTGRNPVRRSAGGSALRFAKEGRRRHVSSHPEGGAGHRVGLLGCRGLLKGPGSDVRHELSGEAGGRKLLARRAAGERGERRARRSVDGLERRRRTPPPPSRTRAWPPVPTTSRGESPPRFPSRRSPHHHTVPTRFRPARTTTARPTD
jgi:hypothetical protein